MGYETLCFAQDDSEETERVTIEGNSAAVKDNTVILSVAKDLIRRALRSFAALRMTSDGQLRKVVIQDAMGQYDTIRNVVATLAVARFSYRAR